MIAWFRPGPEGRPFDEVGEDAAGGPDGETLQVLRAVAKGTLDVEDAAEMVA